eukprot:m.39713 g.39713  ORF g.39713 m.39713 type:complete len:119 (-) comp11303_c0_seq3:194-550(-)
MSSESSLDQQSAVQGLMQAAESGDCERLRRAVKLVEAAGLDVNSAKDPATGQTALHMASIKGRSLAAQRLIQMGACAYEPDRKNRTPLDVCSNFACQIVLQGGFDSSEMPVKSAGKVI